MSDAMAKSARLVKITNDVSKKLNGYRLSLDESLMVLTGIIGQPASQADNLDAFCADIERRVRMYAERVSQMKVRTHGRPPR